MPAHLGDRPLAAVQVAVRERECMLEPLFSVTGFVVGGGMRRLGVAGLVVGGEMQVLWVAGLVVGGEMRGRPRCGIEHQCLCGATADRLDGLERRSCL